jgi:hypothetical protein
MANSNIIKQCYIKTIWFKMKETDRSARPMRFYKYRGEFFRDTYWLNTKKDVENNLERKIASHSSLAECEAAFMEVAKKYNTVILETEVEDAT